MNADVYVNANGDLTGYNMYAYCSNNPVMNVDLSGESITTIFAVLIATTIIGGIIGGVSTYAEAKKNNEKVTPGKMIKNITLGAGAGLAVGGAVISLGAVSFGLYAAATAETMTIATAAMKATILGTNVKQAFGIGALAIHAFGSVIVPLFGGTMDAPEYEPIPEPQQPSSNIPHIHPVY